MSPKQADSSLACGARLGEDQSWVPVDIEVAEGGILTSVRPGGPGFVAAGMVRLPDRPDQGTVWTSADGASWQRVTQDGALPGVIINGVVAGAEGWLVVGVERGGDFGFLPGAWRSPDGQTWTPMAAPEPMLIPAPTAAPSLLAGYSGRYNDVAIVPDGSLVAVGVEAMANGASAQIGLLLVTSTDGMTWTRVPDVESIRSQESITGDFELRTVVSMDNRAIVGGALDGASVWIGTPTGS